MEDWTLLEKAGATLIAIIIVAGMMCVFAIAESCEDAEKARRNRPRCHMCGKRVHCLRC